MQRSPIAIRGSFELRHTLRCDLAVQLVQPAAVGATHLTRAVGRLSQALGHPVRIDHDLGRVLPEAAHPEHRKQRVAVGDAHEQPLRATGKRLVAQVLDQRGRHLVGVGPFGHLQVQHLHDLRPRQVEAALLP